MVYFASHEKWQVVSKPRNVTKIIEKRMLSFCYKSRIAGFVMRCVFAALLICSRAGWFLDARGHLLGTVLASVWSKMVLQRTILGFAVWVLIQSASARSAGPCFLESGLWVCGVMV